MMAATQPQHRIELERSATPAPRATGPSSLATGIEAVDRNLPTGGLPCGRVTELVGPIGSGRASFVISIMARLAQQGERSAVIDLRRDLDPAAFVGAGLTPGWVWVVRPPNTREALWAADLLLRSGHFRLVWLDGLERGVSTAALVRLQRQARDSDAAVLIGVEGRALSAPGSLRLTFRPLGVEWASGLSGLAEPVRQRLVIEVGKGQTEALIGFEWRAPHSLGRHPLIADRRPARWTESKRTYAAPWHDDATDLLAAEVFGGERRGPHARPPSTTLEPAIQATEGQPQIRPPAPESRLSA